MFVIGPERIDLRGSAVQGSPLASVAWLANLFIASIVALDGTSGAYKWYYQVSPRGHLGASAGQVLYDRDCLECHGVSAIATVHAPDLRRSAIPLSAGAFASIVRDGGLVAHGMPNFPELNEAQLTNLRQYIRTRAAKLRQQTRSGQWAD